MSEADAARKELSRVAKTLAYEKKEDLDWLKLEHDQLARPDFLWHYLLQSFATMGGIRGWAGLMGNKDNYNKVRYEVLAQLSPEARASQVEQTCLNAKVNYPRRKADYIIGSFNKMVQLGGPEAAKQQLLSRTGRAAKTEFLQRFPGIGPKYARNIMMDVYHEDFRNSIAVDARIKTLSAAWRLTFGTFEEHEDFYLSVAADAGLNGWELDRLMFNFQSEFFPKELKY